MPSEKSIFLFTTHMRDAIYSPSTIEKIQDLTENDGGVYDREDILRNPDRFKDVSIAFSGWGSPTLDEEILDALPNLKAYFYGAGSVKSFVTDAFWDREIVLTSAYTANAVPVAEFTVAMANISLKRVWHFNNAIRAGVNTHFKTSIPGMYAGTQVGIISLGAIGRLVCQKMSDLNVDVFAYDPFASDEVFEEARAERADSLDWLFKNCDVVSLHAPWLPETENMITGEMFRAMKSGATFINTSRGMVVDEQAMLEVLTERPEIYGVIDVIQDESKYGENPLGRLPNVFLTPHIAGSMGRECHRMGDLALEECRRYMNGDALITPITRENVKRLA